jgi:hypothetical protein
LTVADAQGNDHFIPDAYGRVTLERCLVSANAYVATPTRNSQNNAMLYQFLSNSMTEEAKLDLLAAPEVYTIGEIPAIIGKAMVDTIVTVMTIRNAFASLDTKSPHCREIYRRLTPMFVTKRMHLWHEDKRRTN